MINALQYQSSGTRVRIYESDGVPTQTSDISTGSLAVDFTNSNLYQFNGSTWRTVGEGAVFSNGEFIADNNGNELLEFSVVSSAVNHIDLANAATGNAPSLTATGGDTNIDLNLASKGTGKIVATTGFQFNALKFDNISAPQEITGPGAVNITTNMTLITTTGADAYTLADGSAGQYKTVIMVGDGGNGTLTPTTGFGYSTITFNDVADSVLLQWITGAGWRIVANNGCTVA